jgi:hypothetical protein
MISAFKVSGNSQKEKGGNSETDFNILKEKSFDI